MCFMKMKRILAVMMVLLLAVGLYACGKAEKNEASEKPEDEINADVEENIETTPDVTSDSSADKNPVSSESTDSGTEAGNISEVRSRVEEELKLVEEQEAILEENLQNITSQMEMNQISYEIYQLWDDELNAIWRTLKEVLEPGKMEELTEEQREWITYKENEVNAAGAEFGQGTMRSAIENSEGTDLTKKRVYELVEYLK